MAPQIVNRRLMLPALLLASGSAWADDGEQYPPPPPPPGASVGPVYPAPVAQDAQTTYLPQSVALSGPEEIEDYAPTRPPPAGYTAVERPRKGLIIGGAVTLGVSYGMSVQTAANGSDASSYATNELAAMWIPVAGPFLQMTMTDSAVARLLLLGVGGAQTAGAIMLYYGLTTKKRVMVRNDLVSSMTLTPMAGGGATGMALAGRF